MGTTSTFLKLRSTGTPKLGEWNINFDKAMDLSKKGQKYIIACWSNGDACGYCTAAEKCMMDKVFTDWQKSSGAYFVFQYSGDKDKGKTVHDWCFKETWLKYYPGFRVTVYGKDGKVFRDKVVEGNTLRGGKTGTAGAKNMVANLTKLMADMPIDTTPEPQPTPAGEGYKVRLNEKLTVAKINKVLDAIDANNGYCPCQSAKTSDTKCHCKDFRENKKIGEPCICKIYVKQKKGK